MLLMFFSALVLSLLWMTCAWLFYLRFQNATIVDLAWTIGGCGVTVFYFLVAGALFGAKYIVFYAMIVWAARLTLLILYRILRFGVDGRYKTLDKSFESNRVKKYFFFFMFQGISLVVFTLPVLILVHSKTTSLAWDIFSTVFIVAGLAGVILADIQLQLFIAKPTNKGKVCQKGLWNYSRHPNYFFEWIYWCGIALFALPLHLGWIGLLCPIALLITLLFITGIPPSEKQALLSKKEAYEEYQRTTSRFVPWFKKKG